MARNPEEYKEWGYIGGWIPPTVVLITLRWFVLPNDVSMETLNYLMWTIGLGGWGLCAFAGNLAAKYAAKNNRSKNFKEQLMKEEIRELKRRIDKLAR